MKRLIAVLVFAAALTAHTAAVSAAQLTCKGKIRPYGGECGAGGVCFVFVYDGPADALYIACTPAQEAILMNGAAHDVVVGMFGTAVETTPVTELYVISVTS